MLRLDDSFSPWSAWRALLVPLVCIAAAVLPACGDVSADTSAGDAAMFDGGPRHDSAPAAAAPTIPDHAPTVAFLGDSITAGLHLPPDQAFPQSTQRLLADEGLLFRIVDAGVSGDTSAGGLRRVDWVLRSEPDIVVIELGGNDGLRGQSVKDIRANLAGIIEKVRAADAQPLLVGMLMPSNYGPRYTADFAGLYEELADEYGVPLVPRFMERIGGQPKYFLGDQLHPSPDGHAVLAEVLAPHLGRLLELLAEG